MSNDVKPPHEFAAQQIAHRIKSRMPQGLQTGLGATYLAEAISKELESMYTRIQALETALAKERNGGRDPEDIGP